MIKQPSESFFGGTMSLLKKTIDQGKKKRLFRVFKNNNNQTQTFDESNYAESFIPACYKKEHLSSMFVAYQPDSYISHNAHPEFNGLFDKFIKHNELNNTGDITRLWSFILNIKQIISENIEGDFAELGVWRGNTATVLAHFASLSHRKVFLFDTYTGFDKKDITGLDAHRKIGKFSNTSMDVIEEIIGNENHACEFVKGYFPDSITNIHKSKQYAAVSLDCDLYQPMKAGLDFFYSRMPQGGIFLLHDYSSFFWEGAKKAIDEFCDEQNEYLILMPDKSGSAFIRKSKHLNSENI